MSRVQIKATSSRTKWLVAAASGLVLAAWWLGASPSFPLSSGQEGATEAPAAGRPPDVQRTEGLAPAGAADATAGAGQASLQAELDVAARALGTETPLAQDAPVRERPGYVSPVEWLVLQRVSQQHADPQAELTRMVHFLRFHKLLERWQTLPAQVPPTERQQLAANLVTDLPRRVAAGDVSLTDARAWLPRLVAALEPDESLRSERLAAELARVTSAVPARPPG